MLDLLYEKPKKKILKPLAIDELEDKYDNSIYEKSDFKSKYQIGKLKDYINNDRVSTSILDYNKRKLANEKYLEYLKLLNMEGLVKYKGKDMKKLFWNIETSGDYIQIGYDESSGRMKIVQQYIEKHTLAPLNELAKSRKNAVKVATMINYISSELTTELYFITLTIPNVPIDELPQAIEDMNKKFKSITTNKKFKEFGVSYIKKIESTYNGKINEAHPHFHFIFKCNKEEIDEFYNYLLSQWFKKYPLAKRIAQDMKELDMSNPLKAAQEVATYTAKSSDYLNHGYNVFKYFYLAFTNKSNLTFNGLFRELNKLYKDKKLEKYLPEEFKVAVNITHLITMRWNKEKGMYNITVGVVDDWDTVNEEIITVLKL